jgi:hypothetical protein
MGKLLSVSEKTGFLYYITIWKKCPDGDGKTHGFLILEYLFENICCVVFRIMV